MTIENAKYNKDKLSDKVVSVNCMWDGKLISVPLSQKNRHYQAILEWAKIDGNTIAEAD